MPTNRKENGSACPNSAKRCRVQADGTTNANSFPANQNLDFLHVVEFGFEIAA
jgi:hypothetical protein